MRPELSSVFRTMAMDLIQRVVPAISPTYHQGTIGMIANLLSIASEEWDRGASRRFEENQRLREIFRDAAPVTKDSSLSARLALLAATSDSDLRIPALEKSNCELRAALIDLHSYVESQMGSEARKVEEAIWAELARSTERRRISTAPF